MIPFKENTLISSYFEVETIDGWVQLLPFGHSKHFPIKFNVDDKKIIAGELNFYNTVIYKNFDPANFINPSDCKIEKSQKKNLLVILNILDNCFGHSLLKLFYATAYIESAKSKYDFLLIMPSSLRHFVKSADGLNILTVDLSFPKLEKCKILNKEIKKVSTDYQETFIEETKTHSSYDKHALIQALNLFSRKSESENRNKIIFYYRSDYYRMWAGRQQAKNLVVLFTFLRQFFSKSVEFIVVGDKDNKKFPSWIKDERIKSFSGQTDFHYNDLFKRSLICVGLTGSHMLFPSLLCHVTVHLHPSFKYKNMAEDIVVEGTSNDMLSAYRHLYYNGNFNCSDLKPLKLGYQLMNHFQGRVEKEYKTGDFSTSQAQWINENYPDFRYDLASKFRNVYNARENRKIAFLNLLSKYF